MKYLKFFWLHFKKATRFMGDFISAVVLFVFYYTIFALFAIPYRLSAGSSKIPAKQSTWISKAKNLRALKDFKSE